MASTSSSSSSSSDNPHGVYIPANKNFPFLYTIIRDKTTSNADFARYATRIMIVLGEEALGCLPVVEKVVTTPTQLPFQGVDLKGLGEGGEGGGEGKLCLVSIIRAGDSLMECIRTLVPSAAIGKILIQRDESTPEKLPRLYYSKLPPDIHTRKVLLCDPMLATGGSALVALDIIITKGDVKEENIVFVCVIACPEGIKVVREKFPKVVLVCGYVDEGLNEDKYIVPGLGDFGDRFYF